MACAVIYMANTRLTDDKKNTYFNSRIYEQARILAKQLISDMNSKLQSGEGNSNYGNKWITNKKTFEQKLIKKGQAVPHGWIAGRKKKHHFDENGNPDFRSQSAKNRSEYFRQKRELRYQSYVNVIEIRKYQNEFGWPATQKHFGLEYSIQNFSQMISRVRRDIDHVLPYCEGKTKEEILEILKPRQGAHSVNG